MWRAEEALWTGGPDAYAQSMDPVAVKAFPGAGILDGPAIAEAIAAAPRWASVTMAGRVLARPAKGLVVLGYTAEGRRDGAAPYRAACTSTWREGLDGWRLVQHAQPPS
ncbi:DUF4440 domain-containing protein [Roseomonas sp. CCTCC AB2023176]|uniref:DUF4440 domain-containing protein n=1 Tax=Roseomonas sp. CCTCC AB2023176 TaxID=3342640 RepID=UPI0035D9AED4